MTMGVEITDDKFVVTHPNFKAEYTISRPQNGTGMWSIKVNVGNLPSKLCGLYTSSRMALKALELYLANSKEKPTVRRDNFAAERKERKKANAAKLQSEDS